MLAYSFGIKFQWLFLLDKIHTNRLANQLENGFVDDIQRAKTMEFEQCKETNFLGEECRKFDGRLKIDQLDSGEKVIEGLEDGVAGKMP